LFAIFIGPGLFQLAIACESLFRPWQSDSHESITEIRTPFMATQRMLSVFDCA
jgi:hypothetical protein